MDIDFDELDRAVNSVLAKDLAKSAVVNNPVVSSAPEPLGKVNLTPIVSENSTSTISVSNKTPIPATIVDTSVIAEVDKTKKTLKEAVAAAMTEPEAPVNAQPVVVSQPQIKPLPVIPILKKYPPVGRPDTGRVMDVTHVPADPRATLTMPERPFLKTPTLTTDKPNIPPVSAANQTIKPVTTIMSVAPIQINPPVSMPASVAAPIDPLKLSPDEEDDIDRISNDIADAMKKKNDESLSTPFLTNTKVDKRPLNAFMPDSVAPSVPITIPAPTQTSPTAVVPQATTHYSEKPALSTDKANYATMMKPSDLDAPLPPELQSELLNVEADTTVKSEAPAFAEPSSGSAPVYAPPVAPSAQTVAVNEIANVATSIQPQYKETPSTGEQNNGAIYDTKTYHKALKKPSAVKSGGMWLVYIVILLVVGAGVGAAVFFLILPQL